MYTLQWRHERDGVSNHLLLYCLLNRLFRRRSRKTSKLRVIGLVWAIHQWPVNFPHKGPVTRKMFPFDDVTMNFPGMNVTRLHSRYGIIRSDNMMVLWDRAIWSNGNPEPSPFIKRLDVLSCEVSEAARLDVIIIVLLWNLTGITAALRPRCLSNWKAIGKIWIWISQLRDFTRTRGKTSARLVSRDPDFVRHRVSLSHALI